MSLLCFSITIRFMIKIQTVPHPFPNVEIMLPLPGTGTGDTLANTQTTGSPTDTQTSGSSTSGAASSTAANITDISNAQDSSPTQAKAVSQSTPKQMPLLLRHRPNSTTCAVKAMVEKAAPAQENQVQAGTQEEIETGSDSGDETDDDEEDGMLGDAWAEEEVKVRLLYWGTVGQRRYFR